MLLVRGVLRRTGPRGVSLRATGAWELSALWDAWTRGGLDAVHAALAAADERAHVLAEAGAAYGEDAGAGAAAVAVLATGHGAGRGHGAARRAPRRRRPRTRTAERRPAAWVAHGRRVLVHASGFKQSPYADIKPAGGDVKDSRKLPGEGRAVPDPAGPGRLRSPRRASSGTPARAARGTRVISDLVPTRPAPHAGWRPPPKEPPVAEDQRRGRRGGVDTSLRTSAVWDAVRALVTRRAG